jgi:hypothetical protein
MIRQTKRSELRRIAARGSRDWNTIAWRAAQKIVVLLVMMFSVAVAQQASPPGGFGRQSLDNAWWTGPMLTSSANTLPQVHFLVEPYLYDVIANGFYNSNGRRVSVPHQHEFGSLTYINYGLVNKLTIGMIPTFDYIEPSNGAGSAGIGAGDLTVQAQYRLHLFQEAGWIPTVSIALQQTFRTGRYDQLGQRPSDGMGAGAFTTSPSLYTQTFSWMPNGRILRMRFNVVPSFSRQVNVNGVSVYGTMDGFQGHAKPGNSVFVNAAWESIKNQEAKSRRGIKNDIGATCTLSCRHTGFPRARVDRRCFNGSCGEKSRRHWLQPVEA